MVEEECVGHRRSHERRVWRGGISAQEVGRNVGAAGVAESGERFGQKPSALLGVVSREWVLISGAGHSGEEAQLVEYAGIVAGVEHLPGALHEAGCGGREAFRRCRYLRGGRC